MCAARSSDSVLHQTEADEAFRRFLLAHPGRGTLKIQVSTAGVDFPVPQAKVAVMLPAGGTPRLLYKNVTDSSGIVDDMTLPALPLSYSRKAATAQDSGTDYLVSVYHPAFRPQYDIPVTVFDGIETILPVELEPLMR